MEITTDVEQAEKSEEPVPEDLQIWRDEGRFEKIDGHNIFVHASGTAPTPGRGVLITHGFPGSSIDWKNVVPRVALHTRVVVSDFLGLGQSDKPTDGTFETYYSLFTKADQVIEIARREGLEEVVLVIHDMGQSVGAEIMARHEEGKLPFKIKHAIILNGSTLVDMVHFVPEQVAMLEALRFWLDLGVDGFRLDAVPYLYEREGKDQHAFCITIDRDDDVRTLLNIKPPANWMETALQRLITLHGLSLQPMMKI